MYDFYALISISYKRLPLFLRVSSKTNNRKIYEMVPKNHVQFNRISVQTAETQYISNTRSLIVQGGIVQAEIKGCKNCGKM